MSNPPGSVLGEVVRFPNSKLGATPPPTPRAGGATARLHYAQRDVICLRVFSQPCGLLDLGDLCSRRVQQIICTDDMPAITTILCPVDRSPISTRALAYAVALARAHSARVHLLEVIEFTQPSLPLGARDFDVPGVIREGTMSELQQFAATAAEAGVLEDVRVREGHAASEILRDIDAGGVDLLVIGTHGRSGFERLALGSVTEKVLHKATCPVLVVPPGDQHPADRPFRTVLCPTDFSEAGDAALEYARFIARVGETKSLQLLNVVEWSFGYTDGDDAVSTLRRSLEVQAREQLSRLIESKSTSGVDVEALAASGNPAREILDAARARLVDLIVMGVAGRGALDLALLGSTTHKVVRRAPCPVLVVPKP